MSNTTKSWHQSRAGLGTSLPIHHHTHIARPHVHDIRNSIEPLSRGAPLINLAVDMELPSYHVNINLPEHQDDSSNTRFSEFSKRVSLERLYHSTVSSTGEKNPDDVEPAQSFALNTTEEKPQQTRNQERTPDYFANVGDAIRTLREDIPDLFNRELNYSIYRDDIVFKDPRNKFEGMKNYKLIFWSLRFHGRLFFSKLYVEIKRIWQPTDDVIKMRWTVHGIPRVPWEAEGIFDGISTYKLDKCGRVYEHSVDNVLLRDPPMVTSPPLLAGLNLVPGGMTPVGQPYPGAWGIIPTTLSSTSHQCTPQHDVHGGVMVNPDLLALAAGADSALLQPACHDMPALPSWAAHKAGLLDLTARMQAADDMRSSSTLPALPVLPAATAATVAPPAAEPQPAATTLQPAAPAEQPEVVEVLSHRRRSSMRLSTATACTTSGSSRAAGKTASTWSRDRRDWTQLQLSWFLATAGTWATAQLLTTFNPQAGDQVCSMNIAGASRG